MDYKKPSVNSSPSSFSIQNAALPSPTKSSSITEPASAAAPSEKPCPLLPLPGWGDTIAPSSILAIRQLPHVLLSQHTCWWPWFSSVLQPYLLAFPAVLASGPASWLFSFCFSSPCTCLLFLPAVSIPHLTIPVVVQDSCSNSGTGD